MALLPVRQTVHFLGNITGGQSKVHMSMETTMCHSFGYAQRVNGILLPTQISIDSSTGIVSGASSSQSASYGGEGQSLRKSFLCFCASKTQRPARSLFLVR